MHSLVGTRVGWMAGLFLLGLLVSISACQSEEITLLAERVNIDESDRINRIILIDSSEAYLMGGERWERGFLYRSIDGGTSWNPVDLVADTSDFWLTDLTAISPEERVCVGYGGQVFYSADKGVSWSFLRNLSYAAFEAVTPRGDGTYILGGGARLFNGDIGFSQPGQWWNIQQDTFPILIRSMHCSPSGETIVGGYGSVYVQTTPNGNWQRTRISGDIFNDIYFPSPDVGYICGFNGSIWRLNKDVSESVNLTPASSVFGRVRSWHGIHFYDELHGAVVGAQGEVWWTIDGGNSWRQSSLNTSGPLKSVQMISTDQAFIGGDSGYFVKVTFP